MASRDFDRQDSRYSNVSSDSGYESLNPNSLKENPDVVIRRNFRYLRENINVEVIKDWLIQTATLDQYDQSQIENVSNSFMRNEELLKCMIRKGKYICLQFLSCIKKDDVGLCHIYEELKKRCDGSKPSFKRQLSTFKITKECLLKHRESILKDIEPKDIADLLFEAEVLSVDDHDEIIMEESRIKKGKQLLSMLQNKEERFLDSFLHALEMKKSIEILRVLREDKQPKILTGNVKNTTLLVQQNYRYVVENIHCEILILHLCKNNQLDDEECECITTLKSRKKGTTVVKKSIKKGEEACQCLLNSFDQRDVVDTIKQRQNSRPAKRIPQRKLYINCFQTHKEMLMEELEIYPFIDVLFEEQVLNITEHDDIEEEKRRRRQVRQLVPMLSKLTAEQFNAAIWSLEDAEQYSVLKILETPLENSRGKESKLKASLLEKRTSIPFEDNIPQRNLEISVSAKGELSDAVNDAILYSLNENKMDFERSIMEVTSMEVETITHGSVIVHVHPVTDDAIQQLIDAKRNDKMVCFIQTLLEKSNLSFLKDEKIKFEVHVRSRESSAGKQREIVPDEKHKHVTHDVIKQRIHEHWDFLLDELEPRDLTQHFINKKLFTKKDSTELLNGEMPRKDRVGLFLQQVLCIENTQALDFLIKLFKEHGLQHIVKHLHLEPEDTHKKAEEIRKKLIQNFSILMDEIESPMIVQTLNKCSNVTDGIKESLLPAGGKSRKERVQNFLKMMLNNDRYLLEFEKVIKDHGLDEMMKSVDVSHDQASSPARVLQPQEVIFKGSFTFSIEYDDPERSLTREFGKLGLDSSVPAPRGYLLEKPKQESFVKSHNFDMDYAHKKTVVAAIDFGTTYSGYAFSLKENPSDIKIGKEKGAQTQLLSQKMPTSILLDRDKRVVAIGSKAEELYQELTEGSCHRDHYFFRRFKMELHKSQKLNRNTIIVDINGKRRHAMDIFKLFIQELITMLTADIEKYGRAVVVHEIYWVITIPAIWTDEAKQFMREAAEKAGIPTKNITLALEPEVAALYVKECQIHKKDDSLKSYEPGAKFLVMDLGGGTADLTVMEVTEIKTLKQLKSSCGGDWGGESVNREYWSLLEKIFGSGVVEYFKKNYLCDYRSMELEFETKKRKDILEMTINLDSNLLKIVEDWNGKQLKQLIQERWHDFVSLKGSSKLVFHPNTVKNLFMPSLNALLDKTQSILEELFPGCIDIIMVGGFSDSSIIRDGVKDRFKGHRVIEPQEASLAVLKGAVLYGHNPGVVSSRVCNYTYGIEVKRPYMKSDPKELLFEDFNQKFCNHVFLKLAEIGQEVSINTAMTSEDLETLHKDAKSMTLKIFKSKLPEPRYVIEEDCDYVGKITVKMESAKQKAQIWMRFGTSELMVEGRDADTKELIAGNVCLDLLE